MATMVFVHAHPDDEATLTAGAMLKASAEGHRVVVIFATHGEHGESPDDLGPDETVAQRRMAEAERAAALAGVSRVYWLGYADSGMSGWEANADPSSLLQADLDEAAGRLRAIVEAEHPQVLVGYDWHGNYGHPDHIRVHQIVRRAAELCRRGRPRLFEATMNRDRMRQLYQQAKAAGFDEDFDPDAPMGDGNPLGTPEVELDLQVDVRPQLAARREVMACHASQVSDVQGMLSMPAEAFEAMFSFEHYIEVGNSGPMRRGWFF